ncbi:TPPP2 protein, partial [Thinocorus orbignyianus]|nr:TPPP2 protein [Thinocorus orbignyianus]
SLPTSFLHSRKMSEVEKAFCKHGDTSTNGNVMTGKNFSNTCKECRIMNGKAMTSTDIDNIFNKVKTRGACTIIFVEFQQAMKELCSKGFKCKLPEEVLQAMYSLIEGKEPGSVGATKITKAGRVKRLADTSKYSASHREHFDERGKGKGLSGHQDLADDSGYIGAYKGVGTCDQTH